MTAPFANQPSPQVVDSISESDNEWNVNYAPVVVDIIQSLGATVRQGLKYTPALVRQLRLFCKRITVDESGCWNWTGAVNYKGYGAFSGNCSHRFAYHVFVGDLVPGLVIDHLCRNRRCANPAHLELVTMRENFRRGHHFAALGLCRGGHKMTPENTYTWMCRGILQRCCLKCRLVSRQRWVNKRKRHISVSAYLRRTA